VLFAALLPLLIPPGVTAVHDRPGDGGGAIVVEWQAAAQPGLLGFDVQRCADGDTWQQLSFLGPRVASYTDEEAEDGTSYRYRVGAVSDSATAWSAESAPVTSAAQWYNPKTTGALVGTLLITAFIVFFIGRARAGAKLFLRRIAGLDAVEEALGRATEMGRRILYVPGLSSVSDVATIASINILGEVSKKAAKYGTPLTVPTADPIVYTVARETVQQSYIEAGRPDAFDPGAVYFLSDDQFAYAAGVDGIMLREKPATNFFIGMFWAEALILAETGATTGAIQIAGTDAVNQLPFFFCACDYTLMGEELYAASAYLSREPLLLGSLVGQDASKLVIIAVILLGSLAALIVGQPVARFF
jgi:hypothetical protein